MGRVLRTTGKLAKNPYRIQKIERNIYSLEELCYSLVQSAQFLDAEIMDPVLVQWLREECGLPDLAERLGGYLGKERLLPDFTSAILNQPWPSARSAGTTSRSPRASWHRPTNP